MRHKVPLFVATFVIVFAFAPSLCRGQDAASPKFGIYGGAGSLISSNHNIGSMQFGAEFGEDVPNAGYGFFVEGGYVGPWSRPKAGSAILSVNYVASWVARSKPSFLPFATAGYSRLFGTGNALNIGGGLDYLLSNTRAIRIEVRDYAAFTTPRQHNIAVRVGLLIYISD